MSKENRNPPKQYTGPQGVATLLAEYQEQRDLLSKKLDMVLEQLDEVLELVTPAISVGEPDDSSVMTDGAKAKPAAKTTTKK